MPAETSLKMNLIALVNLLLGLGLSIAAVIGIGSYLIFPPNRLEIFLKANDSLYEFALLGDMMFTMLAGLALSVSSAGLMTKKPWARTLTIVLAASLIVACLGTIIYRLLIVAPLVTAFVAQLPPRNPRMMNCAFGIVIRPGVFEGFVGEWINYGSVFMNSVFLVSSSAILLILLQRRNQEAKGASGLMDVTDLDYAGTKEAASSQG